jgi:predicted RNA-binding Zn-ribbon protein involved in translation (DUF1610 family)
MIQRNCLECTSCGTAITTRFGVGHGTKQVHAFGCPNCGVPITCVMRLDHSIAGFGCASFDEPENARWIDHKTKAPYFVTFHAEVLAPRKAFEVDGLSPFVIAVHYFEDYGFYQVHELARKDVREKYWPGVKRAAVHFERRQWDHFGVELKNVLEETEELRPTFKGKARQMSEVVGYSVQWFVFDYSGQWTGEAVQFARAVVAHPAELQQFADEYRKSGRMVAMWRQLLNLHNEYIAKYPSWAPILQLRYWKEQPKDLDDLVVSDKRFEELKTIYLTAFELLGKISTIALAVELIATTGSTTAWVMNKGDVKSIWDFEALDTGNKHQQLSKHAAIKHFVPLLDTKLRNGIGHAAAHYDAVTDEVVCVKAEGANLTEWRISYTRFCHAVVEVMSNLFFAEQYLFDLLGLTKDLLPSRKKPKAAKVQVVPAQPMPASGIKHVRI